MDPRTAQYIHHMLVYVCSGAFAEVNGSCFDQSSIIATSGLTRNCLDIVINGWAVGGSDLEFPLDTGIPLGPDEQFDTVLMEIHYNNPNLDAGQVDDSGFIWHYTDMLRTHDVGTITIGHVVNRALRIPPKSEKFIAQGYCPNQCTSLWPYDINVIASLLHSHTAGSAIWTQIIRDNEEIGYLDMNMNYDFNFQASYNSDVASGLNYISIPAHGVCAHTSLYQHTPMDQCVQIHTAVYPHSRPIQYKSDYYTYEPFGLGRFATDHSLTKAASRPLLVRVRRCAPQTTTPARP